MATRQKPALVAVDDTLAILKIIETYFSADFAVHTFEDGSAFLCTLDLMMPGMDGLELLQELRSRRQWNKTCIIILSSKYSAVNRDRALSLGADAFEQKPFDPEQFKETVKHLRRKA